jgi:cytochrome c oxidase subunit 2
MLAAFGAVFVLVLGLLAAAIVRSPAATGDGPAPPLGRVGFIVAGGLVLPIVILTPLFWMSLRTSASLALPPTAVVVRVVGHMWWWEVRYPGHGIVTANEIHIPAGRPVRLELASADVIHSFWVPCLNGKRDMIPGIETVFWIQADEPGVLRGVCGEYCGTQHANMAFVVVALEPDEFDAWIAQRSKPHEMPATPLERRGYDVFLSAGCGQCHAITGTPATGNVGPDLTHLGSRLTIAAGTRPNTPGELAGWIADPQAIKPGVKMPRTPLTGENLMAVAAYLEGLK